MLRFFTSRFLQSCVALFIIVTATFFMQRFVPGGPFTAERATTPEIEQRIKEHYRLNDPLWKQYADYMWQVCPKKFAPLELRNGLDLKAAFGIDLGPSYRYASYTVNEIVADKLPVSLELGFLAIGIALCVGVPLGVIAAVRRNSWPDYSASTFGMIGICTPTFVVGPIAVLIFAIYWRHLPASGWIRWDEIASGRQTLSELFAHRVLPATVLGLAFAAPILRITRGGMLDVLNQDFIRTARAKGASELRVVLRHGLRGGLLPLVSYLGPAIAGVLTGSFVIESIFQIPGLGREFVTSIGNRDYMLVIGTVIVYAGFIMALNLLADVLQAWMNPKIRLES
jgi:oligopeptide transport system permease protein